MIKNNNYSFIKTGFLAIIALVVSSPCFSQFYYKDQVVTQQINGNFHAFKQNKVSMVKLNSFQGSSPVTEGFLCEQTVNRAKNQLVTYTKTADAGESYLTSYYNTRDQLIKTIDSSQESVSYFTYRYDENNRLVELNDETRALDNSSSNSERHFWQYNAAGKPVQMLRIRNISDSTVFSFVTDEKGNVTEEEGMKKGVSQGKTFYYYDDKNRLTDVVRYNVRARRLLPDYMFEYEEDELSSMTLIPEGSDDYQKWFYKYDENGLKAVDFCFNKKNELLGKVEYAYQFSK